MAASRPNSMAVATGGGASPLVVSYEERLDGDPEWAMEEGSRHFEERSAVHQSLRRITGKLDKFGIDYAVAGGMALFRHGYRRFTEDVDLLVTKEGLREIHDRLEGRGYLPPFARSKQLRDTELGVRIEFLVAGQYPGDGKPKPVAFPHPADVAVDVGGVKCVSLERLIEMKLASGMTSPGRARDLADVQALIGVLTLQREFANSLHEYVRPTYEKLWDGLHAEVTRFIAIWPGEQRPPDVASIDDLIRTYPDEAERLVAMKADGVLVERRKSAKGGYLCLVTTDPEVGARYDMHPETEFMDDFESEAE